MPARDPVEHPLEGGGVQQVRRLQPLIVPERHLLARDGADPRPLDLDLPPGQHHVAALGALPLGLSWRLVRPFGADHLRHLGLAHWLRHHQRRLQADDR
jgi:hypothetical protein